MLSKLGFFGGAYYCFVKYLDVEYQGEIFKKIHI